MTDPQHLTSDQKADRARAVQFSCSSAPTNAMDQVPGRELTSVESPLPRV
jgi:hypothetical protein